MVVGSGWGQVVEVIQRDLFDWFASIWIPLFVGVATVVVSIAALVASSRATSLAREVERQRDAAEKERAAEAQRRRLIDMSVEEARALHRYVIETLKPRWPGRGRLLSESSPPKSPLEQARDDARVMLEQSIVPGAQALLKVTERDLELRWEYLPESAEEEDEERAEAERKQLQNDRIARTFARIREWALDPEQSERQIVLALNLATRDPERYLASARREQDKTTEWRMTDYCPECGAVADVTRNPDRYTLPPFHGVCRKCGHEWNFTEGRS
ncbi:hypothetical protein [Microbacterium sp. TNHR37B]|uniref:hypothetical protein n=1 Tax=Microbacterium sp. TNHR37B TaxID=1775956 RepID=UPI0007B283EE|nr:hypothetical protein [Microbacterium sp. TNHR37B]KZE91944.1 hypothetical protein AVP41_01494 [Microbacterium sp. TNHR37B]